MVHEYQFLFFVILYVYQGLNVTELNVKELKCYPISPIIHVKVELL